MELFLVKDGKSSLSSLSLSIVNDTGSRSSFCGPCTLLYPFIFLSHLYYEPHSHTFYPPSLFFRFDTSNSNSLVKNHTVDLLSPMMTLFGNDDFFNAFLSLSLPILECLVMAPRFLSSYFSNDADSRCRSFLLSLIHFSMTKRTKTLFLLTFVSSTNGHNIISWYRWLFTTIESYALLSRSWKPFFIWKNLPYLRWRASNHHHSVKERVTHPIVIAFWRENSWKNRMFRNWAAILENFFYSLSPSLFLLIVANILVSCVVQGVYFPFKCSSSLYHCILF